MSEGDRLRQALRRGPIRTRDVHPHQGLNKALAVGITRAVGTMWAFYLAGLVMTVWMGLSVLHVIRFDPYPFAFLLFLGNIVQLLLMFVIMVGQQVLSAHADARAESDHEILTALAEMDRRQTEILEELQRRGRASHA